MYSKLSPKFPHMWVFFLRHWSRAGAGHEIVALGISIIGCAVSPQGLLSSMKVKQWSEPYLIRLLQRSWRIDNSLICRSKWVVIVECSCKRKKCNLD